jgi:N-formylglutamate deformylase
MSAPETANAGAPAATKIAVLHVPHSSRFIPSDERAFILLNDDALETELLRMTDAYTDELFPLTPLEASRVIFPASRLVCDVERFSSDENEPLSKRGMGAIYTRTSAGGPLREPPSAARRQYILDRWYWPHHLRVERRANEIIAKADTCLIIDCHSFSSVALPYELDQSGTRPDLCIGTDHFHTPASLRDAILAHAKDLRFSVLVDRPFAGSLVPIAAYRRDQRVSSVMIEINRRLYMDEASGRKSDNFNDLRQAMGRLVTTAAETHQRAIWTQKTLGGSSS